MKALVLFCGAGGSSMGLHRAGFDVLGIDIAAQLNYPFRLLNADALTVKPRGFDFLWASPPCQAYTNAQKIRGNSHPDLIADVRKILRGSGIPYCIENVPGAPLLDPVMLCGSMFGLRTYRHRLFECSFPIAQPDHPRHTARTTRMGRAPKPDEFMHVVGNFSGAQAGREAMGIDWMTRDELREAIPPAYSEHIARAFLAQRKVEAA